MISACINKKWMEWRSLLSGGVCPFPSSADSVNRHPVRVQTSKLVGPWELKTCKGKYSSTSVITTSLPILSDFLAQMISDIKTQQNV